MLVALSGGDARQPDIMEQGRNLDKLRVPACFASGNAEGLSPYPVDVFEAVGDPQVGRCNRAH